MATMNISLPVPMKAFVEEESRRGGFSTVSEYLRSLVREAQDRKARQDLETRLLEGLASEGADWTASRREQVRTRIERALKARKR